MSAGTAAAAAAQGGLAGARPDPAQDRGAAARASRPAAQRRQDRITGVGQLPAPNINRVLIGEVLLAGVRIIDHKQVGRGELRAAVEHRAVVTISHGLSRLVPDRASRDATAPTLRLPRPPCWPSRQPAWPAGPSGRRKPRALTVPPYPVGDHQTRQCLACTNRQLQGKVRAFSVLLGVRPQHVALVHQQAQAA